MSLTAWLGYGVTCHRKKKLFHNVDGTFEGLDPQEMGLRVGMPNSERGSHMLYNGKTLAGSNAKKVHGAKERSLVPLALD